MCFLVASSARSHKYFFLFPGRPCGVLATPTDGSKVDNGHLFGDVVTFSCKLGFRLSGNNSRQCLADGTWSGYATGCNGKK